MNLYNHISLFEAKIKSRELLNREGSGKKTYHIILDIKNSSIQYEPGDSIAIIPQNDPKMVDSIIKCLNVSSDEKIIAPKSKEIFSIKNFLLQRVNISKISSNLLEFFIKDPTTSEKKHYSRLFHLIDLLKKFPEKKIDLQTLCNNLLPLLPRLYSIASSLKMHPDEIHLIITLAWHEFQNIKRYGVCSNFICNLAEIHKTPIPFYVSPTHGFNLTKDNSKPIIMLATGCGISPFKTFLEERWINKVKGFNWLFFGERNSKFDFYFESFFKDLENKNFLKLTTAFSRDQENKIYVQDKFLENGKLIWELLQKNAIIYICGTIKMSKDINEKMKQILSKYGNMDQYDANIYLKNLIKKKRFLKDVY